MAQALFVTRDDIVRFTALNGNIDVDKFVQYIKIAQDTHIQTYLGTQLFNRLNDDIVNDDLTEPYTTLLSKYIKPMVIHWSMVEALPFLAISALKTNMLCLFTSSSSVHLCCFSGKENAYIKPFCTPIHVLSPQLSLPFSS